MIAPWFRQARFGLFVHWSHCSQRGLEVSWPLAGGNFALPYCSDVPVDEYHATASTFDPQSWDARELARAAKAAGMQYAVITSKHHDGYAMYDTKLSDYSIMRSPFGRDVVREFLDAMRDEGLRAGLYYSLIDWRHEDYPPFTDEHKPYNPMTWPRPDPDRWPRFWEFMSGQLRELLTDYGRIDLLWFDGGWERTAEHWRSQELEAMIRELQPEIVINDRLPGVADYTTPEQFVPPTPPEGPWETCLTMNESWGYNTADVEWKSSRQLVHTLCEVAGRGGNLLLNVGPMGDGRLQPEADERLRDIARWMERHGESIVETEPGLEPWQWYGPSTRRGDVVYLHLLMKPYERAVVRGVPIKRVRSVRALGTGDELPFDTRGALLDVQFGADPTGEVSIEVPERAIDPIATVLAVEIAPLER